jgi:hypothetical protein
MMTRKVKVVEEIKFPDGRIVAQEPVKKGDRVEVVIKPSGGKHEEWNTVIISLPWSLFEGRVEEPWMISSIPSGTYKIEWRDPDTPGGFPILWFQPAETEEGEEVPLLVEAPGPLSEDTDAHSPGVWQVVCVCDEGDTLRAWTLIAAKPGDVFTCEEYGFARGVADYETTYIGCRLTESGFVDDFARMDTPPESLEDLLDYLPRGEESQKSFLVPCRGAADGLCMVGEDDWRKIWKEMHALVTERGGKSPGPKPITEPGVYEFEWEDEDGRHVYEMWVMAKKSR